ncbi:39S ribosomal protein L18, mitochondrial [Frankliniella occidentalis]|uniref:Large ribosomal subunit protein uL18m n=1 Tax=Frankliniella occidentalis TaxID=133901 RepID=A0A9C6XAC1_FRAOC|nr:39S ribosomal protein L18, mitochondrial [Frankliniella occidentalis]XP_052132140.1 39S ribosomal protein L18, mitochondrial [Frankliniella occidentalis]XP_052132141.1 39S ribosomal protein L18, mitochondrial [Frankliniella occidentalis]
MTTSLQLSGRALQRHAQNVMCLFSRQSSSASSAPVSTKSNNDALIRPVFHNRNPRNLELMTIAQKPEGYHLDRFNVSYWHKLVITVSQSKVSADIVHNNGSSVVSASTGEFGIRKFLYRPTDVSAYKTIGKVIAQRSLESGINSVFFDLEYEEGTKLAFLMEEAMKIGLSLEEAPVYTKPFRHTRGVPTKPWDIVV